MPPQPAVATAQRALTILLVEDEELMRASAAALLRDLGHSVLEARSAEAGLAVIRVAPIDVLMTDLGLPGQAGEVFAAEARSILPDLRIIFATGSSRILAVGGGGATPVMLRKPYDGAELAAALTATHA
jgi:CheY-like chemotaxis protein